LRPAFDQTSSQVASRFVSWVDKQIAKLK